MGKAKILLAVGIAAIPAMLAGALIGGAMTVAATNTGASSIAMAEKGITEYLTGPADDTEGAKYWNWTTGASKDKVTGHEGNDPWCASFTSWVGYDTGLYDEELTPKDASAIGWVDWYRANPDAGEVYESSSGYTPEPGDLFVRDKDGGHIGIVVGTDAEDTAFVEELLGQASGIAGAARKANLEAQLASVRANDSIFLTVEGNTGDSSGSGRGGNSIGVHTRGLSSVYYFIHVYGGSMAVSGTGDFKKYRLTEDQLEQIASLCSAEQGSVKGAAAEASLMANRYELHGKGFGSLYSYVRNSGWWAKAAAHMDERGASRKVVSAVRTVLADGKRTVPLYVDEHDWIGDIGYVKLDGSILSKNSKANYVAHKTIIYQDPNRFSGGGSSYRFYSFPAPNSDPFGYTSEANRKKYGDDCYALDGGGNVVGGATGAGSAATGSGWLSSAAGLEVTQVTSSKFSHGEKSRANQKYIVLHDTEMKASAEDTAKSWKNSNDGYVAAHFIVDRDGSIVQCVSMDQIAHHAGYGDKGNNEKYSVSASGDDMLGAVKVSGYPDYGMNSCSVGIEMVHAKGQSYTKKQLEALDGLIAKIDAHFGKKCKIIDHKAWRSTNSDTSKQFKKYLRNYQSDARSYKG